MSVTWQTFFWKLKPQKIKTSIGADAFLQAEVIKDTKFAKGRKIEGKTA